MDPFVLEGTEDTPRIVLDPSKSTFELSGRSLPEDSTEFFQPILDWIGEYSNAPSDKTVFEFKLEYFNTASSRLLLEVLSALEEVSGVEVIWYFHDDDEDMEEAGEEYAELVDVPFTFKTY